MARDESSSLCSGEELLTCDRELVQRGGGILGAPRGHHLGQVLERAAAADRELGFERLDLRDDRRERLDDARPQCAAVGLRDRIRVDAVGGEAGDPERHAGCPHHAAGVAHHDLEAAATEVEAHRGRGIEHDRGAERAEDQARLLLAADDLDVHAGLRPDAVDELAAVRGAADGAGRLGQELGGAGRLAQEAESAHGRDGLVRRGRWDDAAAAHHVAEAEHLLLLDQRVDVPVGVHVGNQEVEGVRPQVHGGDAHRPHATGGRGVGRSRAPQPAHRASRRVSP